LDWLSGYYRFGYQSGSRPEVAEKEKDPHSSQTSASYLSFRGVCLSSVLRNVSFVMERKRREISPFKCLKAFGLAEFYSFLWVGVLTLDGPGEMVGSRMMPAGSDSTNSGSWRDFLNPSLERDSVGGGALTSTGPNGAGLPSMWEEDSFELDVLEESFSSSKTVTDSPPAEESQGEPSVNRRSPEEAGPALPANPDQGLPTDRKGNPMDLNARPSLSYEEIDNSDSLRARNLQLLEDLERIQEMERNLQNERDPDRRWEVAACIDRAACELEQKIALCQTRDTVQDDQLDVWREGLYEELATQGEKQARFALLISWLKVYNNLNRASLGWAYLHP
ncbi:unnamed protein product, partial [Thlaspi arvense]